MKIWIVQGIAGEILPTRSELIVEWIVEAWPTKEAAEARVTALEALLLQHGFTHGYGDYETREARERLMEAEDPQFCTDYTGTRYYLRECELRHPTKGGRSEMMLCPTCRFYDLKEYDPNGNGLCRAKTPTPNVSTGCYWPLVRSSDWCGEHKPRDVTPEVHRP